jgi:hypothetical protein
MVNDKIYCGSGRVFGKYNTLGLSICIDDIPVDFITAGKNGKRYIRVNVNQKREPDKYGKTHSVEVDTWKPNTQPEKKEEYDFIASDFSFDREKENNNSPF